MKGFKGSIKTQTLENTNFREVLYTGPYSPLVLMSLNPGEEIGMEIHTDTDQFFRFEEGEGKVIIAIRLFMKQRMMQKTMRNILTV